MTTQQTSSPTSLADRLRAISADAHRYAETRELQKLMVQGRLPIDRLIAYLGQLFAVHSALERGLDRLPAGVAAKIGFGDELRHSARLAADLGVAGVDAAAVPMTPTSRRFVGWLDERPVGDAEALLGVLYVLEGSMNGNRFIVRALGKALGIEPAVGLSYFDPYGAEQSARWGAFRSGIDRFGVGSCDDDRVEDACLRTFEAIAAIADEVIEGRASAIVDG